MLKVILLCLIGICPYYRLEANATIQDLDTSYVKEQQLILALEYTKKVKKKYLGSVLIAAIFQSESKEGLLDFKRQWHKITNEEEVKYYKFNEKVYNKHQWGNFVWAFCLTKNRCILPPHWAAQIQTMITENRYDEKDEQKCLKAGRRYAKKWNKHNKKTTQ